MSQTQPARTADPPGTHFVVERLNWRREKRGTFRLYPGAGRVAAFDTAAEADAFRWEHETKAREAVNPFVGSVAAPADQTHLPEPVLCDWLQDHGVDPPVSEGKAGRRGWSKWWAENAAGWSADQRAAVWQALDRVQFFRVVERPRRPVVYAVVEVVWGYNDEWFYPGPEGGVTRTVYRSRERAAAECDRLNAETRASGGVGQDGYNLEGRLLPGQDPFGLPSPRTGGGDEDEEGMPDGFCTADEAPFYEVVELEWEEPS